MKLNAVLDDAPRDLEFRVSDEHHQALKVWLRLLACTNRIEATIRNRLRSEFGVYGVDSGRICVAALNERNLGHVAQAIARVM